MDEHHSIFSWVGQGISLTALLGAFVGAIPVIGALAALVWYGIQIVESQTWKRWKLRRHAKRVARVEAKLAYLKSLERYENA